MSRRLPTDPVTAAFVSGAAVARNQLDLLWDAARYVVVDLETSGLGDKDVILSFGAVHIDAGRVVGRSTVYGLVRPEPEAEVSPLSVTVHSIRPVDLRDAPSMPGALDPLLQAMTGRVLVAHAAWVERAFLTRALRGRGAGLDVPVIDTAALAWPHLGLVADPHRAPGLEPLAQRMHLPVHAPHNALGDALATAQVFLVLASHWAPAPGASVRDLVRASSAAKPGPVRRVLSWFRSGS